MKTLVALLLSIGLIAALNTGCTASASVKKNSDASRLNTKTQVAYVTAPASSK